MFARFFKYLALMSVVASMFAIAGCSGMGTSRQGAATGGSPAPMPKPSIEAHAVPSSIDAGQSSTLIWSATDADQVSVDGIGDVPTAGSRLMSPTATITYNLRATGKGGTAATAVTINVNSAATPMPPPPKSSGSVNVPTWHMDNARSGLNIQETQLTLANVSSGSFGKLFSYLLDGYPYAQPLYVSNLAMGGVRHNVVFAATEYDSVYAFDADSYGDGTPLWKTSLLRSGETPQHGGNPKPWIGITSTPVIDLSTQTIYVVSAQQGSGEPFFRLHALDITTGGEKSGSPVVIAASAKGSNSDSVSGTIRLTAGCLQRTALLLTRGTLYFGFSACHSGWMLAYSASDLRQTGVLNMSPNADGYGTYGGAGGVWMGGGGPVGDDNGNAYVTTGNGPWNGSTEWANSILKLDSQLNIVDYFTPYDWAFLQCKDLDLSGGGAMLIPGKGQILAAGKGGKLYLVNMNHLGGMQPNDAGAAQTLWFNHDHYPAQCTNTTNGEVYSTEITGYQIFGTAASFNASVYLGVTAGAVQQFGYSGDQLHPGPTTDAQIADGSYGTTPFISANGNQNGIMWMLDHGAPIQDPLNPVPAPAVLRAYDATNVSAKLYDSSERPSDRAGYGIKFTSPIVANGKVFIGTARDDLSIANPQGELDVYGLK